MSLIKIVKDWYSSSFKIKRLIDVQMIGMSLDIVAVAVNDQTSLKVLLLFLYNCVVFFKFKANFHVISLLYEKLRIKKNDYFLKTKAFDTYFGVSTVTFFRFITTK